MLTNLIETLVECSSTIKHNYINCLNLSLFPTNKNITSKLLRNLRVSFAKLNLFTIIKSNNKLVIQKVAGNDRWTNAVTAKPQSTKSDVPIWSQVAAAAAKHTNFALPPLFLLILPLHIFHGSKTLPVSRCQRCFPCCLSVCVCVCWCMYWCVYCGFCATLISENA